MFGIKTFVKKIYKKYFRSDSRAIAENYYNRYEKYSFEGDRCNSVQQYEGMITRLYHTVEKGLSYTDYRPGFGRDNVEALIRAMASYSMNNDTDVFFYRTGLSVLHEYIEKNRSHGYCDDSLEKKINDLPGEKNEEGGAISFVPSSVSEIQGMDFEAFVHSRHSIRHFSGEHVDISRIEKALKLAQNTPSACNRQGWEAFIISNKSTIESVLENQNGNRGFGQEIDVLLLVAGDLRYFNKPREVHQVYIDGGMYAMNVLHSLHYYGLGTIPLSGALTAKQDKKVRELLGMEDALIPILFIGVGNYPDECTSTRSSRHEERIVSV